MMQSNGPHCDEGPGALGCSPATQLEPGPECSSPPCCTQRMHAQHTGRDPPGRRLTGPSARAFAPSRRHRAHHRGRAGLSRRLWQDG